MGHVGVCVCVCVCVCERERESVCVCEREKESVCDLDWLVDTDVWQKRLLYSTQHVDEKREHLITNAWWILHLRGEKDRQKRGEKGRERERRRQ